MNGRRRRRRRNIVPVVFTVIVLAAAAVLIAWFFLSSTGGDDDATLSLPPDSLEPSSESPEVSPSASPTPMIVVEVTRDNVKTVVASLERANAYSCAWEIELIYSTGSAKAERKVWVRDGYTCVERYPFGGGNLEQTMIIGSGRVVIWSPNGQVYSGVQAAFTGESETRIPSIAKFLEMDEDDIVDASYVVLDETIPCAYIETGESDSDYREFWWVALDSGLLVKAESTEKESLIYRAIMRDLLLERPDDARFTLPDGTVV